MGSLNRSVTQALGRDLREHGREAVRQARAAGNDALRLARNDVYAQVRQTFDRPTPYTTGASGVGGAVNVEFISQRDGAAAEGALFIRGRGDVGAASVPHQSYLRAQIEGGARRLKKLEVLLQRKGLMPAGWLAVPGKGARMDAYGNVSRGQVVQVLAYLQAMPAGNRRSNMSDRGRERMRARIGGKRMQAGYFVVTGQERHGGLAPGVWESVQLGTMGRGVRPVYVFVKAAKYQQRLPLDRAVAESIGRWMPAMLARRLGGVG